MSKEIEAALTAWREAERGVAEAGVSATPEMLQTLADARARYRGLLASEGAAFADEAEMPKVGDLPGIPDAS